MMTKLKKYWDSLFYEVKRDCVAIVVLGVVLVVGMLCTI